MRQSWTQHRRGDAMRHEKFVAVVRLARELASNSEGLTIDEMAQFAGVARRTAERMRDAVEQAFYPLDSIDEGRKKRFRLTGGLDRFITTPVTVELTELENAARSLSTRAPTRAAHLRSLGEKIRASLRHSDRLRLSVDVEGQVRGEAFACQVGPRPLSDPADLALLRRALLAQKIVLFDYGEDDEGAPRRRKVVPYGLLFGPRYYLVAGIKNRPGPALYRLDRIHNLTVTDEAGSPPEDFDLKAYAEESFGVFHEQPADVELCFSPGAARDARAYLFHPTQSMTDEPDGSLTVRFRAGGLLQIAHHLMTWGNAVTILGPAKLQDVMREAVETLHAHHIAPQTSAGSKRRPSTRNSSQSSS